MAKLAQDLESESVHDRDRVYPVYTRERGPGVVYVSVLILLLIVAILYFS